MISTNLLKWAVDTILDADLKGVPHVQALKDWEDQNDIDLTEDDKEEIRKRVELELMELDDDGGGNRALLRKPCRSWKRDN